jgi:hypothetical protein
MTSSILTTSANREAVSSAFQRLLWRHRAKKGTPYTHTAFGSRVGSYSIASETRSEFERAYAAVVDAGVNPSITEKPGAGSQVCIDLDFRYAADTPRQHTAETIKAFLGACYAALRRYVRLTPENDVAYVFEREGPYQHGGVTKDGIHIMFPGLHCAAALKWAVREHVLVDCKVLLTTGLGATNSIDDIVDAAIIEKNNWYMYGSGTLIRFKCLHIKIGQVRST